MANLISIGGRKSSKGAAPEDEPVVEVPEGEIAITERAARAIEEKLRKEGKPDGVFRVGIQGGGCAGLSYLFRIEDAPSERDQRFTSHGVTVVVDPRSLKHLAGTLLDWREELGKSGFEMRNPRVRSSCSCGASFSL